MTRFGLAGYMGYATVTGAVVLAVEILGTRVIAPYYGGTIVIWTALITVTLVALAIGYLVGGWWIDRNPSPAPLFTAVSLAAAWLFGVQAARGWVLSATLPMGLHAGAVTSATVLFLPPLLLLGMVSPMVIRLGLSSVGSAGRVSGMVYAVSTLGSVGGAVLTGFVLVQYHTTGALLSGIALVLALAAGVGFICTGRRRTGMAVCALGLLACALRGSTPKTSDKVLHAARSVYGRHLVVEDRGTRFLAIDGFFHSAVDPVTLENRAAYIVALELLPFMRPEAQTALHVGLGGGVLPTILERHYGIRSDVAEIDPAVPAIARDFFGYESSGDLHLEDGRTFLSRTESRYDLVVIDAFSTDRQPWHLFTRECFAEARRVLEPGGVLALNTFGYKAGPGARAWHALVRTLRLEFAEVAAYAASRGKDANTDSLNVVLFASDTALAPRRDLDEVRDLVPADLLLLDLAAVSTDGLVLTDEFNPMDRLTAPVFEPARRYVLSRLGPELLAD